jgi:tricarballylate dehydrogenase
LVGVCDEKMDRQLAQLVIEQSSSCPPFMTQHGCRWQPPLGRTLHLARTNRFFLGGGKSLLDGYYAAAQRLGVAVEYNSKVVDFIFDGDYCRGVEVQSGHTRPRFVPARSIVVAAGGFEANLGWLERYWGKAARNFIIRGSGNNDGIVLESLLSHGAASVGDPKGLHAVAVDARSPAVDGGLSTRLDSVPFGIVVNRHGIRFADEGAGLWPKHYANWGSLIAHQDDQIAYSIVSAASDGQFVAGAFPPFVARSIEELATQLAIPTPRLRQTVDEFNHAVPAYGVLDYRDLDGVATVGLSPPKSNWASKLVPPFHAYPLRPGVTFTYLGLKVDDEARAFSANGAPYMNLFAAGEIMAGNLLSGGYLAGIGMTIGTVFGRIAGLSASRQAATVRGL